MSGPEKQFEKRLKDWLTAHGCWFFKVFGNAYQRSGIPDIVGCVGGRMFGIEVKAANGRPSPLQLRELRMIREAGGYARVLYPDEFEDFKKEFAQMIDEGRLNALIEDYRKVKDIYDRSSTLLDGIKQKIEEAVGEEGYKGEDFSVTWVPVKEKTVIDWERFAKTEPEDAEDILKDYPKTTKSGGYFKYTDKRKADD